MILSKADGFTVPEFRIYCGNTNVNEGLGEEQTCKNVMQLG